MYFISVIVKPYLIDFSKFYFTTIEQQWKVIEIKIKILSCDHHFPFVVANVDVYVYRPKLFVTLSKR